MLRAWLLLIVLAAPMFLPVLAPLPATASERAVSGADLAEIRDVIRRSEIGACASYRPVSKPLAVRFLEATVLSGHVVQPMRVTDAAGGIWVAYYAMQRQPGGGWRANGCHLVQPTRTIPA